MILNLELTPNDRIFEVFGRTIHEIRIGRYDSLNVNVNGLGLFLYELFLREGIKAAPFRRMAK